MRTTLKDTPPLTHDEFLALAEIEARKLERFAHELRKGKWATFRIDESFTAKDGREQEKATITIEASRFQVYGACRTVMTDGEESPPQTHQFEGSWQPGERRGIEHERYEVTCFACGLTIVNPTDAYPIDHCPPVEALTLEWLELMSYPKWCVPKQKKLPYQPPTLRPIEPHEVIRKLLASR